MFFNISRPIVGLLPVYKSTVRSLTSSNTKLKTWDQIPGPKSYPFIGALPNFLPGGEFCNLDTGDLIKALHNKYGSIVRLDQVLDKKPSVLIFDAEGAEQVYRAENQMPIRPILDSLLHFRKSDKNLSPDTPMGLIIENGKPWQEFRSTVNPVLMQPKIMKLYTSSINDITSEMVQRLIKLRDDKNMVSNLKKEIYLWSLESLGEVALGCRLNCFDNNLDKDSPERQLIEVVENLMRAFGELDIIRPGLWKYYPTKTYKKAKADYQKQDILAKHFIEKAIKEFKSNPKPDDQKGVLEKLLDINKEVALIMATDMLMAGLDTTTHQALGALYLLATNIDKQSKLRAELKTNDAKKIYLRACLKEVMRMMPVVSGSGRLTTKEYNILGYKIPKGVFVFIMNHTARMDKYFPKPLEFIPERWIVEKDDPICHKHGHPFAFNPFGFGSRSCIGRRIAELELEAFIEQMVKNFEFEWFGPPPKIVSSSVSYVEGPYNFIFEEAK